MSQYEKGHIEQHHIRTVTFVREQDGVPERQLKQALRNVFYPSVVVRRAYLARVCYDGATDEHVALCLAATSLSSELRDRVSFEFAKLFSPAEHFDILFINRQHEAECAKVCRPFYEAG